MNSISEITTFAKNEKSDIWNCFYGNAINSNATIGKLQKHELNALLLLSIENQLEFCKFLECPSLELEHILNNSSYKTYKIAKKKGGAREIAVPDDSLKKIQKRLNYFLQAHYLCIKPNEVHGFVVNPHYLGTYCNIVANAQVHIAKKYVLNIDLKDFFPSISEEKIKTIFSSKFFNFNEQLSATLTQLTTFEGKLPIGAPTSPVISNFVCHQLDADLKDFCSSKMLSFTRYADDLTFSANEPILKDIVLDIIGIINKNDFEVNAKKLRLTTANRKQTVTGLTVNEKVNVDRKLIRKIRAMLHDLNTNGIETAAKKHFSKRDGYPNIKGDTEVKLKDKFIYRLEGFINFVGQVKGTTDGQYVKFKSELKKGFGVQQLQVNS